MTIGLINPYNHKELKEELGNLVDDEGRIFPKKGGVFRILDRQDYTSSFGFQWNKFETTQIDKFRQEGEQSQKRFRAVTGWNKVDTAGQDILEVGCGAGRFTHAALELTRANIYSVDSSSAIEANFRNNGPNSRLHLLQASVYDMPFLPGQFDKVLCLGVLQHTPYPRDTVRCLAEMVKPGGELVVDFYPYKNWYTKIHIKYILRPWTKRLPSERLLDLIEKNANGLIKIYKGLDKLGIGFLNRFVPICDIKSTLPSGLSSVEVREWVILDTFDMFSPMFDKPQKLSEVRSWFVKLGLEVNFAGSIEYSQRNKVTMVKGTRPNHTPNR